MTDIQYTEVCNKVLSDSTEIKDYKKLIDKKIFSKYCTHNTAVKCMLKIRQSSVFDRLPWEKIQLNDSIDSVDLFSFELLLADVKLKNYNFSTSTILYLYQALDILHRCRLDEFSVIEIGAGYGGLCFMINTIAPLFNKTILKYTLADKPDISEHQKKYISDMQVLNVDFVDSTKNESHKADLFISIYVLENLQGMDIVESCAINIVQHCTHHYLWWNLYFNIDPFFGSCNIKKNGLNISELDIVVDNFSFIEYSDSESQSYTINRLESAYLHRKNNPLLRLEKGAYTDVDEPKTIVVIKGSIKVKFYDKEVILRQGDCCNAKKFGYTCLERDTILYKTNYYNYQ